MLQHINSLRAFSVIIVVFYHFNIKYFEYGFLGVDIFLAISGFLIAKIISEEIKQKGNFSIYNFLLRRAKRLFPVILFLLLISTLVSYFLFYDTRVFLNKSIFFNYLLAPNFFFWANDINYFSESILNSNFLKHTWSLGLEYQFYVIFSLIFFFFKKGTKILVFTLFVFSFFLDIYFITVKPSASFYLIPTRLWEFLLGSIFYFTHSTLKNYLIKTRFLDLFSIFLIIFTIFFFTDISLLLKKFIIVFFSCVLITFYKSINTFKIILDNKYLNYIGLISFSLYLWHYFLFKFVDYFFWEIPVYLIIFISIIISIFSYHLIEKPFRKNNMYKNFSKKIFLYIFVILLAISYVMQKENVGLYKYDNNFFKSFETDKEKCIDENLDFMIESNQCLIGNLSKNENDFILLGDSIAFTLANSFNKYGKKNNIKGFFFAQSSCPPLIGVKYNLNRDRERKRKCEKFNDDVYKFIEKNDIKKIIIIANWSNYITEQIFDVKIYEKNENLSDQEKRILILRNGFKNIQNYTKKNKIELIVFSQLPVLKNENAKRTVIKEIELKERLSNNPDKRYEKFLFSKNQFLEFKNNTDIVLNDILQKSQIIDVTDFFCDTYCKVSYKGRSLYNDKTHFSKNGGEYFFKILSEINF